LTARADSETVRAVLRRRLVGAIALLALRAPALACAGELKTGWTAESLVTETMECTESLVQGAWENTKREQGADPALPLTKETRDQLAPQITSMKKLCACAVRAGAERYTKAEADATPKDLERFVADTIAKGDCKLSHE
jgi:hypothetical protein